jgi:hypothetical protein
MNLSIVDYTEGHENWDHYWDELEVKKCAACKEGSWELHDICWNEENTEPASEHRGAIGYHYGCDRVGEYYGSYLEMHREEYGVEYWLCVSCKEGFYMGDHDRCECHDYDNCHDEEFDWESMY